MATCSRCGGPRYRDDCTDTQCPSLPRTRQAKPTPTIASTATRSRRGEVHTEVIGVERGDPSIEIDRESDTMWAEVEWSMGITINMGNFNSLKGGVKIRRPCRNTDEAIEKMARRIHTQGHRLLDEEAERIMALPPGEHVRGTK